MDKKERTAEELKFIIDDMKREVRRKEKDLAREYEYVIQTEKKIPEINAKLESEIAYLEKLRLQIPNFDLKIYEQYKEYESVEKNIKKLEEEIPEMYKMLAMGREYILKTKHFIETNNMGIQRLQAELDEKLKKSEENK